MCTWSTLANPPTLQSYPFCFSTSGGITQSPLAWGRNHTLYYGLVGYSNTDGGATSKADLSAELAKSTDLGNTWSTVLVANARGKTGTATGRRPPGRAADPPGGPVPSDMAQTTGASAHTCRNW